jgi:hypothetical protein
MKYLLNPRLLLRGWYKAPTGLFNTERKEARFLPKEEYILLMQCDDYYGIDEKVCYFFENGWEERITKAAEEPFREYLKRHPEINRIQEK